MKNFDDKNCSLIGELLKIKDRCYFYEKNFLGEDFYNTNRNDYDFIHYSSFYSTFRDICDLQLFFLVNEEISNSHERDLLPLLIEQVFKNCNFTLDTHNIGEAMCVKEARHFQDLKKLFAFQYNEILSSSLLDFTVSAFSTFEYWVDKLYRGVCPDHENRTLERRIEKISIELKKYAESPTEDNLKHISKRISSKTRAFISFPDKINGICEHIDKNQYPRDLKKDLELVDFISRERNTVHNLGIHRGADTHIIFNGIKHFLKKDEPEKYKSAANKLKLLAELLKIYTSLLYSLNDRGAFISSFADAKTDFLKIGILTQSMNDFLLQDIADGNSILTQNNYADFLCKRFGFSCYQSHAFIENLKSLRERKLSELDTYKLLAISNPKSG